MPLHERRSTKVRAIHNGWPFARCSRSDYRGTAKERAPANSRESEPATSRPREEPLKHVIPVIAAPQFALQSSFSAISNTRSMAFSPDGRLLVSGCYDNSVRLWSVATGQQLKKFTGHSRSVTSVAFSPDGRSIRQAVWIRRSRSGTCRRVQKGARFPDTRAECKPWLSVPMGDCSPRVVRTRPSRFGMCRAAMNCEPRRTHWPRPSGGLQFRWALDRFRQSGQNH